MTKVSQKKKRWSRWAWPGLLAAGAGGAAMFLLRGCWHTRMGWPMQEGDHSYQVCLGCGIKRLFDEKKFHGYGPYGYDVKHCAQFCAQWLLVCACIRVREGTVSSCKYRRVLIRTPGAKLLIYRVHGTLNHDEFATILTMRGPRKAKLQPHVG